jgi:AraC-like DNA-binding protein
MMQTGSPFSVWVSPAQKLKIPLMVRSCGRYFLEEGARATSRKKWIVELLWTISGSGTFMTNNTSYEVKEGDVFIYRPGDAHDSVATGRSWAYCWITWEHPEAVRWVSSFGLEERVHPRGSCPQWLFEEAAEGLREGTAEGQRRASQASHGILLEAAIPRGQGAGRDSLANRARTHLDTHFQDPELTLEKLADVLEVHRTTLFRTFLNTFGISPSEYLYNRRMESALALLHRTNLRIKEVALRSGFNDANYFSRAVRKATGASPREFQSGSAH